MIMSLTVDDILDCCTNDKMRNEVINKLVRRFEYIDERPCESFLGMRVAQDCDEIRLSQDDFILSVVEEFPQAYPTNTPGAPSKVLGEGTGPTIKDFSY
jgi:Reverse transcriptase (RNA-dependent DNA polymerase)